MKTIEEKAMERVEELNKIASRMWELAAKITPDNPANEELYKTEKEFDRVRRNAMSWGRKHGLKIDEWGFTFI